MLNGDIQRVSLCLRMLNKYRETFITNFLKKTHGHGQQCGDCGGEGSIRRINGNGKNTIIIINKSTRWKVAVFKPRCFKGGLFPWNFVKLLNDILLTFSPLVQYGWTKESDVW